MNSNKLVLKGKNGVITIDADHPGIWIAPLETGGMPCICLYMNRTGPGDNWIPVIGFYGDEKQPWACDFAVFPDKETGSPSLQYRKKNGQVECVSIDDLAAYIEKRTPVTLTPPPNA